MTHRPISSLLLYMQVFAVWALILAASIFSLWNDRNDQLVTILLFGAGAIIVPVYQLVVRGFEERKYAKFLAMVSTEPQLQSAVGTPQVDAHGAAETAAVDGKSFD